MLEKSYSACGDFVTEAAQAIREIESQGQLPIICGGTEIYIQSLLEATIWVAPFPGDSGLSGA